MPCRRKGFGKNLKFVPNELKNIKLCIESLRSSGENFKYVPKKLKNAELCMASVRLDGKNLKYVPEEYKSAEVCLNAVIKEFSFLQDEIVKYIPKRFRNFKSGKNK